MMRQRPLANVISFALALLLLAACSTSQPTATATRPTPTAVPSPAPTVTPEAAATATAPAYAAARRFSLFTEIWTLVRDRYVYPDYGGLDWEAFREEVAEKVTSATTDEEFYDLMRELVDQLGDEHSVFLSPEEVAREEAFYESLQVAGGIGASLAEVDGEVVLVQVLPDNPAFEAGLRPGERIVAVDGTPTEEFSGIRKVILAIVGEPGTPVVLSVRSLANAEREVSITRAVVDFRDAVVRGSVIEGTQIGLLALDSFDSPEIPDLVRETLGELASGGTLEGLIVDVRANGGGTNEAVLGTLAIFVDGGSIGRDVSRDRTSDLLIPEGETMPGLEGLPVVVLTGPYTMSAAECFAAGMQVQGRALIVGLPSAGNTESAVPHPLAGGSEVYIAEQVYQLPDGTQIEGRGVQPDVVVEAEWGWYDVANDPQILAAREVLGSE